MGEREMYRFARLRFQGGRFDGSVFPVEALSELAAYSELVLEAAKAVWHEHNPHRTNIPRGFDAAFSLLLADIEEGSAMPLLVQAAVLANAIQGMEPEDAYHYFDAGRHHVAAIVEAASRRSPLPSPMTTGLESRFVNFGNRLRQDERVQFVDPDPEDGPLTGPTLDQATRSWIIESIPREYSESADYVGEIIKGDKVKNFFEIMADGRRVPFVASPAQTAELLTWMRDDTIVRMRGKAIYRTIGGFQRLEVASIAAVQQDLGVAASAPCPLPISVQLADIARLPDGWLDGDGAAYSEHALTQARGVLDSLIGFGGVDMPYLYPSPDGAFRAEWNHPDRDVVVILDASATRLRLLAVDAGGAPTRRETYNTDDSSLKKLATLLEELLKEEEGP